MRFEVRFYDKDDYTFRIYDKINNVFIGGDIHSETDAYIILEWYNNLNK